MAVPPGIWVDVGSAILLLVLSIFVISVKPRRGPNLAFAAFAAAMAVAFVVNNLFSWFEPDAPANEIVLASSGPLFLLVAISLVWIAFRFPAPLAPRERRYAWIAAAATLVGHAVGLPALFDSNREYMAVFGIPEEFYAATLSEGLGFWAMHAAFWFTLVLLPLRHRHLAGVHANLGRQVGLTAAALVLYPGVIAGSGLLIATRTTSALLVTAVFTALAQVILTAGLWIWNTAGPQPRLARNIAVVTLGSAAAGAAYGAFVTTPASIVNSGAFGLARTIGVIIFAYAILRHQLLGIDLKVKWGIRRGTFASILLCAFFVVTVTAENLLTTRFGWAYGGVAAGLLLFAGSPLQRLGDRVANAALPGVGDDPLYHSNRRREVYAAAYHGMIADGRLTEKERDVLARLADDLGLGVQETRAIEKGAT